MTTLPAIVGRILGSFIDPTVVLSFSRPGFLVHSLAFDPGALEVDLSSRRVLITGANQGIGYEAALGLAKLGAQVVLLCRDAERGRAAAAAIGARTGNRRVAAEPLDVSDLSAVRRAARRLAERPVDVLVHNAGLLPAGRVLTADGLELTMATHVVGPHLLTHLLVDALGPAARIVWVSSGGMYSQKLSLRDWNWEERQPYDGVRAYAQTKRMQVALAELWAERLAERGTRVNSMHPGWADTGGVRTSIPRFHSVTRSILRTPAEGADTIVWLSASPAAGEYSGRFFLDREPRSTYYLPFTRESDAERRALWSLCDDLAGCTPPEAGGISGRRGRRESTSSVRRQR